MYSDEETFLYSSPPPKHIVLGWIRPSEQEGYLPQTLADVVLDALLIGLFACIFAFIFNAFCPKKVNVFEVYAADKNEENLYPHYVVHLVQALQCVVLLLLVSIGFLSYRWLRVSYLLTFGYFLFDLVAIGLSAYWGHAAIPTFLKIYEWKKKNKLSKPSDHMYAERIRSESRIGANPLDVLTTFIHHITTAILMVGVLIQGLGFWVTVAFNLGELPISMLRSVWFYKRRHRLIPRGDRQQWRVREERREAYCNQLDRMIISRLPSTARDHFRLFREQPEDQMLQWFDKACCVSFWLFRTFTFFLLFVVAVLFFIDWRRNWFWALLTIPAFFLILWNQYLYAKHLTERPFPQLHYKIKIVENKLKDKLVDKISDIVLKFHKIKTLYSQ